MLNDQEHRQQNACYWRKVWRGSGIEPATSITAYVYILYCFILCNVDGLICYVVIYEIKCVCVCVCHSYSRICRVCRVTPLMLIFGSLVHVHEYDSRLCVCVVLYPSLNIIISCSLNFSLRAWIQTTPGYYKCTTFNTYYFFKH